MYRYHRKELVTEMRMYEIRMIKPLTPDQARVKSMQDQVKRTQQAIKAEKGADYFRHYPSKDEIMGDALKPTWDELNMGVNMGKGVENGKQVDTVSQSASRASSTMKAGSP